MFLNANGLTFHVDVQGVPKGPALVLLHSLGTTLHLWDPQMEVLGQCSRVIRLDLRGHGLSDAPAGPYTMEELASDVLAVLDRLDVGQAVVAGVSIGGMIAQCLWALAPHRVRALILVDSSLATALPAVWRERAEAVRRHGIAPIVRDVAGRWVTPAFADSAAAHGLRTMLLRTPADGLAGCSGAIAGADMTPHATVEGPPVLVIVGDQDRSTPPAMAESLRAAWGGRLEVLAGAAHIPNFEKPAELARVMRGGVEAQGPWRP